MQNQKRVYTASLSEQRHKLCELSRLTRNFRDKLREYCKENNLTTPTLVAEHFGIEWHMARRAVQGTTIICGGETLTKLTERMNIPEVREKILQNTQGVEKPMIGMAHFSEDIIGFIHDIKEKYATLDTGHKRRKFFLQFKPHHMLVSKALRGSYKSLKRITHEPQLRATIQAIMEGKNPPAASAPTEKETPTSSAEFAALLEEIKRAYPGATERRNILECHHETMDRILQGKSKPEIVERVLRKARDIVAKIRGEVPTEKVSPSPPLQLEKNVSRVELSIAKAKEILTPETFAPVAGELTQGMIVFAKTSIQATAKILNSCAQLEDEDSRSKVRNELTPVVEELYLAIETFSNEHPNFVLDLINAQRETWKIERRKQKG